MNILTTTFFSELLDVFIYSIKHAALIIPFIFISYLLIEYVTHKHSEKINGWLSKKGKYGAFIGSALGIVPQCGFSTTVATLYSRRIVTIGTLFAVLISTSDEAILLFIRYPEKLHILALLLVTKFVVAASIGLAIDKFLPNIVSSENEAQEYIEESCKCCNHNIWKSSIKHTLFVFGFLFVFTFLFKGLIVLIGEDNLESFLLGGSIFQPVLASLVGLIPNCASSMIVTNLYLEGTLSFSSMLAGLISNAGIGIIVVFRNNKKMKENIKILGILFIVAVAVGMLGSFIEMLF